MTDAVLADERSIKSVLLTRINWLLTLDFGQIA
jgi:hypothetical protein